MSVMRLHLIAVMSLAIASGAASGADFSFPEPTDIRRILLTIAVAGNTNLIIGTGVEGLTTYVVRDRDPEAALVEAAIGAGFTVRKRDNLLSVRVRGSHPARVDEDPPRYFGPLDTVSIRWLEDRPSREIVRELARQIGVPARVHEQARQQKALVYVDKVHPRTFLNVYCEAMGFGWGTTRRVLAVADWHRSAHYVIEMGVDDRTE
jgi:hypothetical protein